MRILLILNSYQMKIEFESSMKTIQDRLISVLKNEDQQVDICSISSYDDHTTYEHIIGKIKYKLITPEKQFEKIIYAFKNIDLTSYDWFIKIRPDLTLLEDINTAKILSCDNNSINARSRWYIGPHINIPYGTSHSFKSGDPWEESWIYSETVKDITPDDHIYIFNKNIATKAYNIFNVNNIDATLVDTYYFYNWHYPLNNKWTKYTLNIKDRLIMGHQKQDEWFFRDILNFRDISINPIGIKVKLYVISDHLVV